MSGTVAELVAGLPSNLAERSRLLSSRAPSRQGEFVLYWMHHAVRAHENPALDAAIELANRIGVPVLAYQGLSGAHRYNNDRHQTFILEGAREAHRELRALGIRSVFFLNKGGQEASPLHALARRAAIVVVEDFPAPPFVRWSANLVSKNRCPAIAVDSACIVPIQAQPKRFERAFEFRRHNQSAFASRIQRQWPVVCPTQPIFDGEIGFDALDLASMDVAETCAACAIDHSVPPIPGTPGGAAAGYRRWRAFLLQGLSGYARDRNDAAIEWPRGVSRMSPYLHQGHVSPFRIAREAAATEKEGCSKFLDEMLVWRELAFNFCFFTQEPERIDALPAWARTTLLDHADDARKRLVDNDSLARSGSNDELWDLAQASLRIHGELHNNLRMTWAKAIPYWRPDPQSALETMIELNHRYALDGSDPNSYGGLLWSLGLFDRPFERKPVMGTVRARSTKAHARRLNLDLYRARVRQPATGKAIRIAVIGAGLSGLSAAHVLHDQGHQVQIFEKSRGLGGRAATRRADGVSFDHGAQYFTARDPAFRRVVEAWCERGVVERWPARMGRVRGGQIQSSTDDEHRFVAVPGMSKLGGLLGEGLDIRRQVRVEPPKRVESRWNLFSDRGEQLGVFDLLIVSAPAPQAQELLRSAAPQIARYASAVQYTPTWATMLAFEDAGELDYDGLFFDGGVLRWAARNDSKPGRTGHTWVLHAAPDWSAANLETPAAQVIADLGAAFYTATGMDPSRIRAKSAHRWLYSLVPSPLDVGALWDAELQLGVCGDWCNGARIEGAFLSGHAVAGRILGHLAQGAVGSK